MNVNFSKKEIQTAKSHMQKFSISLIIKEIQIKTMRISLYIRETGIHKKKKKTTCIGKDIL